MKARHPQFTERTIHSPMWLDNARAARRKTRDDARRLFPWLAFLAGCSLAWFIVKTAESFR